MYTCETCKKEFKKKCHYETHLAKKFPCKPNAQVINDPKITKYREKTINSANLDIMNENLCEHCKNIFSRDYRLKTSDVFCSRICGGKFRKVNNDLNSHDRETANYVREFTKEQVLQIYNDDSVSLSSLALKYGTTKGNIWFIKQKKTYKWVHE
jgi:hypothetical protein